MSPQKGEPETIVAQCTESFTKFIRDSLMGNLVRFFYFL